MWDWLLGKNVEEERERFETKLADKAAESERQRKADVEKHERNAYTKKREEENKMKQEKQEALDAVNQKTTKKMEELMETGATQRAERAAKAETEQNQILQEQEADRKELEREHKERAREDRMRVEQTWKEQQSMAERVSESINKSVEEKRNQIKQAEELKNDLEAKEKKQMTEYDKKVYETEEEAFKTRLALDTKVNGKALKNIDEIIAGEQKIHAEVMAKHQKIINVRLENARREDWKAVDTEITTLKRSTDICFLTANDIIANLTLNMDEETKETVNLYIVAVESKLSDITKKLSTLDRASKKIIDKEQRDQINEHIKAVNRAKNKLYRSIVDVKRELKQKEFSKEKRTDFESRVDDFKEAIDEISQLTSKDDKLRDVMAKDTEQNEKAIEGVKVENDEKAEDEKEVNDESQCVKDKKEGAEDESEEVKDESDDDKKASD